MSRCVRALCLLLIVPVASAGGGVVVVPPGWSFEQVEAPTDAVVVEQTINGSRIIAIESVVGGLVAYATWNDTGRQAVALWIDADPVHQNLTRILEEQLPLALDHRFEALTTSSQNTKEAAVLAKVAADLAAANSENTTGVVRGLRTAFFEHDNQEYVHPIHVEGQGSPWYPALVVLVVVAGITAVAYWWVRRELEGLQDAIQNALLSAGFDEGETE